MTTAPVLEVAAPSRLHFGLLNFGSGERPFGGAGVMVDRPGLRLRFGPAERLDILGPAADRVLDFARRFSARHSLDDDLRCRIEVVSLPRQHAGLGVGTSLGMAVAAGLSAWLGLPSQTAEQLAASVGRGRRSAIGTHGFLHGGFLVETGKHEPDDISPLLACVELPEDWRFALLCPRGEGLSGAAEEEAFRRLPAISAAASGQLRDELLTRLLPAAQQADFDAFSEGLFRFNRAAGECYAPIQAGPYATPMLAERIAAIRALSVRGVGQSSWGPTLFALLPSEAAAQRFVANLSAARAMDDWELTITPISCGGARLTWRGETTTPGSS